jgi:hypothetical protein
MIARLWFLIPQGYLPTPYRLSRCYRSSHTPNFTAIGANDGPDSVQHSTFKEIFQTLPDISLIAQLLPTNIISSDFNYHDYVHVVDPLYSHYRLIDDSDECQRA